MTDMDALVNAYDKFVALPWSDNLAPAQRVWLVIYCPADERRLRVRVDAFGVATTKAHKHWNLVNVTDAFATWFNGHPYGETYFRKPELLSSAALKDFERSLTEQALEAAGPSNEDPDAVIAVLGVGALFPFAKVSTFIENLAPNVAGRLVVFFPGEREGSNYRLLEARDGWNYLATPITDTEVAS